MRYINVRLLLLLLLLDRRQFKVRPSWPKADAKHLHLYKNVLQSTLQSVTVPHNALWCNDVFCCDREHIDNLNDYAALLSDACLRAADVSVPSTKPCGEAGHIPVWSEFVAPVRSQSVFWHRLWIECGLW